MFTKLIEREAKLKKAKEVAISKGGECLSAEYINNHSKLKWKCENNHEWEASYKSVVQKKYWCKKCSSVLRAEKQC